MINNATLAFNPESLSAFNKISFRMYDINGREVKCIDRLLSSETQIGRDDLSSGIYIYISLQVMMNSFVPAKLF